MFILQIGIFGLIILGVFEAITSTPIGAGLEQLLISLIPTKETDNPAHGDVTPYEAILWLTFFFVVAISCDVYKKITDYSPSLVAIFALIVWFVVLVPLIGLGSWSAFYLVSIFERYLDPIGLSKGLEVSLGLASVVGVIALFVFICSIFGKILLGSLSGQRSSRPLTGFGKVVVMGTVLLSMLWAFYLLSNISLGSQV
jgi:hypothetical protein